VQVSAKTAELVISAKRRIEIRVIID